MACPKLVREDDNEALQILTKFQTEDGAVPSNRSPLIYSTVIKKIVVPNDVFEFVLSPSTDLRISSLPNVSNYDKILAGSKEVLPIGRMSNVYIRGDVAGGTLFFRFHTL